MPPVFNLGIDWDHRLRFTQVEWGKFPVTGRPQTMYDEFTLELDEERTHLRQMNDVTCRRECVDGELYHVHDDDASVEVSYEDSVQWGTDVAVEIAAGLTSSLQASLGVEGVASAGVEVSVETSVTASRGASVGRSLTRSETVSKTFTLDEHAANCERLVLPVGVVTRYRLTGCIRIRRTVSFVRGQGQWQGGATVVVVRPLRVTSGVPTLGSGTPSRSPLNCDGCDHETETPQDDGTEKVDDRKAKHGEDALPVRFKTIGDEQLVPVSELRGRRK